MDEQKNETNGVRWEYIFVAFHPCDGNQRWTIRSQALLSDGGTKYDRLHVLCPTTKTERDFFFDITGYFGKL
ncbi:MAG TPA: hypothetical protein VGF86_03905 [Candidatus Tumulicola sp.]